MQIVPLRAYDVIQIGGFLAIFHFFQSKVRFSWQNLKFYSQLQF